MLIEFKPSEVLAVFLFGALVGSLIAMFLIL